MEQRRCYGCMKPIGDNQFCGHCGYDAKKQNAVHQLPVGTVLKDQFLVGKVLGQGGFGITYLGWDLYLNIPVAIKEYYPTGIVTRESSYSLCVVNVEGDSGDVFEKSRRRFLREARSLAQLRDVPQVVSVRSFFPENDTAYIIMEYVQGVTLKDYIARNGVMDVKQMLKVFIPVMEGLQKVHEVGLVHRDISPDNIMLLPRGDVKLLDFGAVRHYNSQVSQSTQSIVKHGYTPPEQYKTTGQSAPSADIYALCATMYYCLTGKIPPEAPERLLEGTEPDWSIVNGLSERQTDALKKGMALHAEDRIKSAEELRNSLLEESAKQPPVSMQSSPEKKDPPAEIRKAPAEKGKSQSVQKKHPAEKEKLPIEKKKTSAGKKKLPIWIWALLLAVVGAGILLWNREPVSHTETTAQTTQTSAEETVFTTEPSEKEIAEDYLFAYSASDLNVTVTKDRVMTVTVGGLSLRNSYTVNYADSKDGLVEYAWGFYAYSGDDVIELSTKHWKDPSSTQAEEMVLEDMVTNLWRRKPQDPTTFVSVCELDSMYHDTQSITWVCTIPDNEDFDLSAMESFQVSVKERDTNTDFRRNYSVDDVGQVKEDSAEETVAETEQPQAVLESGFQNENYTVELESTDDGIVVSGEGLHILLSNGRELTITIDNVSVRDSYVTNRRESGKNSQEYCWGIDMYGKKGDYSISTATWAFNPGEETVKRPRDMQHSIWIANDGGYESFGSVQQVQYDSNSFTWKCTVPKLHEGKPVVFDILSFSEFQVRVFDIERGLNLIRTYTVE